MAKQTIHIGAAPNDGTGDSLRSGAIKINENFTEVYNQLFKAPISVLALLSASNAQRISQVSADQWEYLKAQDQYLSKNSEVEFARLKLTGNNPDLIGPNNWLAIEGNEQKFYAQEIELNNLLQPVAPLEVILSETLRDGIKPAGWQDYIITWQTSDDGYALFSNSASYLISPIIDLANKTDLRIEFEVAKYGSGNNGPLLVEFSYDGGTTWPYSSISGIPDSSSYLSSLINIPSSSSQFRVRFSRTLSPSQKRLRDVRIKARNTTGAGERFRGRVTNNALTFGTYNLDALAIFNDGSISALNNLNVDEDLKVFGTSEFEDDITIHTRFGSESFAPGWAGSGFKLEKEGSLWNLELDSVTIRKYLRAYELLIEKIRVQLGSRALSAGGGTISEVTGVSPNETLAFEDPDGFGGISFEIDDIVLTQSVRTDRSTVMKYVARKVIAINGLEVTVAGLNGAPLDTGGYEIGDDVIVIGNLTNPMRQALIYESVTDSGAPFYRVLDNISSLDEFSDLNNLKLQFGKLSDLLIQNVQLSGYGLFTQNAYMTGELLVGKLSKADNYLWFHDGELHGDFRKIAFTSDEFLLSVPTLHIHSAGSSPAIKLGENAPSMALFTPGTGFYADGNGEFRFGEVDDLYSFKRGLLGMEKTAVFDSVGGGEVINFFALEGLMDGFQFGYIDSALLDNASSSYLWLDTGLQWDDYNYIINRTKVFGDGAIPLPGMRIHFGDQDSNLRWDKDSNRMILSGDLEAANGTFMGSVKINNVRLGKGAESELLHYPIMERYWDGINISAQDPHSFKNVWVQNEDGDIIFAVDGIDGIHYDSMRSTYKTRIGSDVLFKGLITNDEEDYIIDQLGIRLKAGTEYVNLGSMVSFIDDNDELIGVLRANSDTNSLELVSSTFKDIIIKAGDASKPSVGNVILDVAGAVPGAGPNGHSLIYFGAIIKNLVTSSTQPPGAPVGYIYKDANGFLKAV